MLTARLGVVSPASQRVLRAASVGGGEVAHWMLGAATGIGEDELDDALREAIDHQLLVFDPDRRTYRFRHALQREVAYGELLFEERARLHSRYAEALSSHPELAGTTSERVAEVAYHWYAAQRADRAVPALVEAAAVAEGLHGFAEAQRHYERALQLWSKADDPERLVGCNRPTLRARAAEAAHLAGDHDQARVLVGKALTGVDPSADPVGAGLLQESLGRYLWAAGETEAALVAYEEAVSLVGAGAGQVAERARVVASVAQALMLAGRYRESRRQAEEAVELARSLDSRPYEGQALATLGADLVLLGEDENGIAHLREAIRILDGNGRPDDVGRAYLSLSELLSGPLNRVDEAVATAREGLQRVRELGIDRVHGVSLLAAASNGLFRLGRWDEADAMLDEAMALRPSGTAAIDLYLARGRMSVGRGRFVDAAADLDTARALSARALAPQYRAPLSTLTAGLAMWQGELDKACDAVEEGLKAISGTDDPWFGAPLIWHGLRAQARPGRAGAGPPVGGGAGVGPVDGRRSGGRHGPVGGGVDRACPSPTPASSTPTSAWPGPSRRGSTAARRRRSGRRRPRPGTRWASPIPRPTPATGAARPPSTCARAGARPPPPACSGRRTPPRWRWARRRSRPRSSGWRPGPGSP